MKNNYPSPASPCCCTRPWEQVTSVACTIPAKPLQWQTHPPTCAGNPSSLPPLHTLLVQHSKDAGCAAGSITQPTACLQVRAVVVGVLAELQGFTCENISPLTATHRRPPADASLSALCKSLQLSRSVVAESLLAAPSKPSQCKASRVSRHCYLASKLGGFLSKQKNLCLRTQVLSNHAASLPFPPACTPASFEAISCFSCL